MRRFVLPLVAVLVAGTAAVVTAAPAVADPVSGGDFVSVPQTRLVSGTTMTAGKTLQITVAGRASVPTTDVSAVVASISVTTATASGGIIAYGSGTAPGTTNLQFSAKQATSDTAVVQPSGGKVTLKDTQSSGSLRVYFDVVGYYTGSTDATPGGSFHPTTPTRVIDTRKGLNAPHATLTNGRTMVGTPGGHGGIPGSGVGTLAVTITATNVTALGSLTAFAPGTNRPGVPTLYFGKGRGSSVFALVPASDAGKLDVYANTTGSLNVVIDSVGWFPPGAAIDKGAYTATPPSRVYSTTSLGAGKAVAVQVKGRGGIPLTAGSTAVLTIISGGRAGSGRITAWPSAKSRPGTVAVQWQGGLSSAVQIPVQVGSNGYVDFYNASAAAASLYVDVHGYAAPTAITPPSASVARYLNDLQNIDDENGRSGDVSLMTAHGKSDAEQQPNFVLLDLGTQSITPDKTARPGELGPGYADRGVSLALTGLESGQEPIRIKYSELVTVLTAYLDAFAANNGGAEATIAIGTNNDGVADPKAANYYSFTGRGNDWANQLIDPLAARARDRDPNLHISAANDIEAAFASTEQQAQQWETAYLGQTTNNLVYNGDANSCPASFGTTGGTCAFGWTQAQYYALAHNGSRIKALPQIFYPAEAVKWANINATGSDGSKNQLSFVGSLTQHLRDDSATGVTLTADQGWATLNRGLSAVVTSPSLPRSVELRADAPAPARARRARAILSH